MKSLFVVTPCGRTSDDVQRTVNSIMAVAGAHPTIEFRHYLVFNNGLSADQTQATRQDNYRGMVTDLGTIGSRAAARNVALDEIAAGGDSGVVCFIDAGDLLCDEGAVDYTFDSLDRLPEQTLWAYAGRIVGTNLSSVRRPRPLWTRKIGNPFFIGATFVSSALATQIRFGEGAKEDWKYWLELLDLEPHVEISDRIAYAYQVVSVADHLRRKRRLLRDQYEFFADYLGYGHGARTTLSMIAHIAVAGGSWVRRFRLPGRH